MIEKKLQVLSFTNLNLFGESVILRKSLISLFDFSRVVIW